eukprot:3394525-Rhodomonas_salina.1
MPGPRTIAQIRPLLKSLYTTIVQNAAREQAHERAHVLNDVGVGCPYPGCRDKNHVLAKCPIKAEDLRLHSEAQKLKAGKKGKKETSSKKGGKGGRE